ncbi:MAG: hypothetical protein B7Z58_02460 [Acidiphilium sp. 37-64-53]|uniref:hypothetical protein n=1 Tax=Acidiphilium TaxID=522 RepID=UPI000BDB2278|nr:MULTISPECIES: hypothetical protein [Acidiphilium]OYW03799.1 MAG: hypothetical protein B7Z58_02460 [Acidiphilium sp. 37-64-53]OZB28815.1 MAG: hypothetical protein B7X49_09505 [Acidiphilium sp. 34-64-41]HQT83516.1 hypothetical protein [Acidiphilium rubrum]
MRKFALLASVLTVAGAFAPVAANAAVGTSIYQPSPIIVHAPSNAATVKHAKLADGRTVHTDQLDTIQRNRATA